MKNKLKTILLVTLGIVLGTSITVCAYSYSARDIGFTSNNKSWNVDNVEDAINDLYEKKNTVNGECSDMTLSFTLNTKDDGYPSTVDYDVKNYKSFKITNGFANTNGNRTLTVTYNDQVYTIKYANSLTLEVIDNADIVTISSNGTSATFTAAGQIEKMCVNNNE